MNENQTQVEELTTDEMESSEEAEPELEVQEEVQEETQEEFQNELQEEQEQTIDGGSISGMQHGDENGVVDEINSELPVNSTSIVNEQPAMIFYGLQEEVTAKELTNLRSEPSTEKGVETIVVAIKNGEIVTRTGINQDTGWSRLEYEGQTVYAVSNYLTDELVTTTAIQEPVISEAVLIQQDLNSVTTYDGRVVTFTNINDTVSPKNEVNLRGEPSTSAGNDTIHYLLKYGENVQRTGVSEQGWSRVVYNDEILYVITSYIYVIE